MSSPHRLSDKDFIADVMTACKDIAVKYPVFMDFMEYYCGYNTPLNTSDPNEISYSGGKRDVILMIKTLQRSDILPDQVAKHYRKEI